MLKLETLGNTLIPVPLMFDSLIKTLLIKNEDIFKSFLLATTPIKKIDSMEFIRNELIKDNINEKGKITDLLVLINNYFIVDLEFGLNSFNYYKERNINYAEKLNLRAIEVGDKDKTPKYQIIQLNIYNYPENEDFKDDVILNYGMKSKKCYRSNPKIIVKNVAKYKELYYTGDKRKETVYIASFGSTTYEELESILINEESYENVDKFKKEVYKMTTNSLWVEKWDEEQDRQRVLNLIRQDSLKEGKDIGLKQGKTIGLEEGKNIGLEEKEQDLIKGMFKNNASIDFVSKVTGKSISKIKSIKKSLML